MLGKAFIVYGVRHDFIEKQLDSGTSYLGGQRASFREITQRGKHVCTWGEPTVSQDITNGCSTLRVPQARLVRTLHVNARRKIHHQVAIPTRRWDNERK